MLPIRNLIKINQGPNFLFIFSLKAKDFLFFSKIERSREGEKNIKNKKGFQRKLDLKRVSRIRDYLLSDNSYIPTNFIVNICTEDHNDVDFKSKAKITNNSLIELNSENDLLVIDGQHRLAALDYINYNSELNGSGIRFKELSNKDREKLDNYEVIITGYLNISRIEMAKVFITINNNQKKVNKSVIFDLLHISGKDIDNLDQETEEILMAGLTLEQIKATSIIEELYENNKSYWYNAVNYEGGRLKTIELGSFVEHLSLALGKYRFLNNENFIYHERRVETIDLFYKKLIDSIFQEKKEGDVLISKYDQFIDKNCILSKASGVGIIFNKDIFDKVLELSLDGDIINEKYLEKIFLNFNENDFLSTNPEYKGKLSSKAGYSEIIKILSNKIKLG
ncbi:DGQHR domain-containing protein [Candidatus Gracilibacteria bacterium]|nr:DGQHR domain-containing protein [Candidatus Gracilibacteria bacterium]